jgi:hypothetical protein
MIDRPDPPKILDMIVDLVLSHKPKRNPDDGKARRATAKVSRELEQISERQEKIRESIEKRKESIHKGARRAKVRYRP